MKALALRDVHAGLGASFDEWRGCEVVARYGDPAAEYRALTGSAGVVDCENRGRLCVVGRDRKRFLHGQVTNDVNRLAVGQGCYAALVNAKGKMVSDLNIHVLENELLLDFEPGYATAVAERLGKYVVADDVEIVDASGACGMFGVVGPKAEEVCRQAGLKTEGARREFEIAVQGESAWGEVYVARRSRFGLGGFDLFVPAGARAEAFQKLREAALGMGGGACGMEALETARIEFGAPRFGADMDDTNLPPETGLEATAISYSKGCYIGQEIIARVRTYGQVAKSLRGLEFSGELSGAPPRGAKLELGGKVVGQLTSAARSPRFGRWIGLGYVRREVGTGTTGLELVEGDLRLPVNLANRSFLDPGSAAAVG